MPTIEACLVYVDHANLSGSVILLDERVPVRLIQQKEGALPQVGHNIQVADPGERSVSAQAFFLEPLPKFGPNDEEE